MLQPPDTLHRSRDTAVLLRSGLNLIQQALSIYSDELKLVFANRKFKSMFNLPERLCEAGADFGETLKFLAENGEYGDVDDVASFVSARVQQALTFEPHYLERQRANGDWISIEGGPLRQGGWVAVYTDITEVRRQEDRLRSQSDELSVELLDRSEELARTNRALEATINRLHETQQQLEAAEARIRMAAETTPAHIARLNRNEIYTYSNQRLPIEAFNGVKDIVGHRASEVLGPDVYEKIQDALKSALMGDPKVVEFTNPPDNRQIRAAFTPDTNANGIVTGAYVLSMDISLSQQSASFSQPMRATFGGWTAHFDRMHLVCGNDHVPLSVAEAALLRLFLASPNRMLSRDDISASPDIKPGSDRALDVRISRLRQKLRDDPKSPKLLRTVYGAGYILTTEVKWEK